MSKVSKTSISDQPYNIFLAPLILTPHSSVLSTTSVDDTYMKPKQQLVKKAQFPPEETESFNMSSSITPDEENQSNKTSVQSIIKEKSSSNESTPNIVPGNRSNTSKENSSVHSSFQSEQRFIVLNITQ